MQVAGVAERDLGDRGVGLEHRLDGRAHLRDVVERVEDAEDVEARCGAASRTKASVTAVG